jgi:HK97 family phage prohead protease
MGNDLMVEEYPDNDQRLAICYSQWRDREKAHPHGDHVCYCPECGAEITVGEDVKCNTQKCPECGVRMRAKDTGERRKSMERKSVQLELKKDKEGSFAARIATLNVVDKDGDITLPGAFPEGKEVLVSAYQHSSWMGELPVGKAVIKEIDGEVVAEGQFNLDMQSGREHYEAVKFSGGLQEWSYGFEVLDYDHDKKDGQEVRLLKKVEPYEISPVLLGAGIDTATLTIKSETKEGLTYTDQAEMALAAIAGLTDRTKLLADLRRKEGRVLSSTNRERMKKLLTSLSTVAEDLKELLDATEPEQDKTLTLFLEGVKEKIKFMEEQND